MAKIALLSCTKAKKNHTSAKPGNCIRPAPGSPPHINSLNNMGLTESIYSQHCMVWFMRMTRLNRMKQP